MKGMHVAGIFGNPLSLPFEKDRQIPDKGNKPARQRIVLGNLDRFKRSQERVDLLGVDIPLS